MFAIAFDLDVRQTELSYPKGLPQAYKDIAKTLAEYGFERIQGSVYTTEDESLVTLFGALQALKTLPWFPASVRDIRAFKVENWSDFTASVKAG